MLEHTKTQTTGALTEIRFAVPSNLADDFFVTINGMLRVANLPPAQTVDMIPVEQVIPESSPGFRLRGLRTTPSKHIGKTFETCLKNCGRAGSAELVATPS